MSHINVSDIIHRRDLVERVAKWIHHQWGVSAGRTYEQTRARFRSYPADGKLPVTLVAVAAEGHLQGVASLRLVDTFDWLPGVSPWICNVFVETRARGAGVASLLCAALEERAQKLGFATVYLATSRADSVYHKSGYCEVSRVTKDGVMYFVMSKPMLSSASVRERQIDG